jgi:hypothetical protein
MSAAPELLRLRGELERRFGTAIVPRPGVEIEPAPPGFGTGVRALDALVPEGICRGLLTQWTGGAGSGRTAAVRAAVLAACAAGERVALVDAGATLDPADWCGGAGHPPSLWIARPPSPGREEEGAWVAEALLRTGAFALVVLDGAPLAPADAHRLRALARETGAALLVSGGGEGGWRADLRLEFGGPRAEGAGLMPGGRFRRRAGVRVAKGWGARTGTGEIELVHQPTHRLHPHSREPDRRPGPG